MIFDYKENGYLKSMPDDELLERMETRPAIMLACLNGRGIQAAAAHLAKSVYRVARELEHRRRDRGIGRAPQQPGVVVLARRAHGVAHGKRRSVHHPGRPSS